MNPIHKRLDADFERVMQDKPRSAGTLQDQGFRFVCINGVCDWVHPAEIPAGSVDCTDMTDDEFEDFMFGSDGLFVCEEDREPPVLVGMFDPIPMPRDPYGCENPVNQEDSE
jgi:hypothetical protein